MGNFQARKMPRQNRLRRSLILIALLAAAVILSKAVWDIYFKNQLAEQNRQMTDKELKDLEARKDKLTAGIGKLKTDPGVDEEIRKNFSVAKEGEKVVTIVKADEETGSTSATTTVKQSWWASMWGRI